MLQGQAAAHNKEEEAGSHLLCHLSYGCLCTAVLVDPSLEFWVSLFLGVPFLFFGVPFLVLGVSLHLLGVPALEFLVYLVFLLGVLCLVLLAP